MISVIDILVHCDSFDEANENKKNSNEQRLTVRASDIQLDLLIIEIYDLSDFTLFLHLLFCFLAWLECDTRAGKAYSSVLYGVAYTIQKSLASKQARVCLSVSKWSDGYQFYCYLILLYFEWFVLISDRF